ncbi:MAG TPA: ribonucleotide reductase subunit alpha [Rhodanobacteraceae bacterium]|nr:ribonucleotide reductase subunit alpha [Rhodanobacteraceae bacterium]
MSLETFADLLAAAHAEPEPQRLLLVFAKAECPRDASAAERAAFERGEGGALAPVVCVDKLATQIASFDALLEESRHTGHDWDILFVTSMGGYGGHAPGSDEAVQPLRMMVEQIKGGRIGNFLAVDRHGDLLSLRQS